MEDFEPNTIIQNSILSDNHRNKSIRELSIEFISRNSPVSFPDYLKHFNLKRTTGYDIIADLERSKIIETYYNTTSKGTVVRMLKIRSDKK